MSEKADQALKEFQEALEQALKIDQEAFNLSKVEGVRDYDLINKKLSQADELFKKAKEAFIRCLVYLDYSI